MVEFEVSTTRIARGGFGEVFHGRFDGKNIAVKKQKSQHARTEIDFLKKVNHLNVVKYFGAKKDGAFTYIALELCALSLYDKLQSTEFRQGLPEHELVKAIADIMIGYECIRGLNIVHGDIKSKNILVDFAGNYKLADFGLSQIGNDDKQFRRFNGSYSYCHPMVFQVLNWERLYPNVPKPNRLVWPATAEIWSFGVLIFEMTDGSLPFVAASTPRMFQLISQKSNREICAYELPNGQIGRGESFPSRQQSKFFVELTGLVADMLQVKHMF